MKAARLCDAEAAGTTSTLGTRATQATGVKLRTGS